MTYLHKLIRQPSLPKLHQIASAAYQPLPYSFTYRYDINKILNTYAWIVNNSPLWNRSNKWSLIPQLLTVLSLSLFRSLSLFLCCRPCLSWTSPIIATASHSTRVHTPCSVQTRAERSELSELSELSSHNPALKMPSFQNSENCETANHLAPSDRATLSPRWETPAAPVIRLFVIRHQCRPCPIRIQERPDGTVEVAQCGAERCRKVKYVS